MKKRFEGGHNIFYTAYTHRQFHSAYAV